MSEKRYSAWQILGVLAVVVSLCAASLAGGLFLGYQWGQASGMARAFAGQGRSERTQAPLPAFPMPFGGPERRFGGQPQRAYLGVRFETITPELAEAEELGVESGAIIREVVPGSPADEAGLEVGDIVQQVDGETVDAEHPLGARIMAHAPGDEVKLTVRREGEAHEIAVTLGARDAAEPLPLPRSRSGPGFRFELRCTPEPCSSLPFFRYLYRDDQPPKD